MKKDKIISPMGLKGREINERMKELMGMTPINENTSKVVVELTKMGPDGRAYAIVRENHEHYIKITDKTSGIVAEDFKYIGGLQNKQSEAYPSYANAIKHLNLNFKSLAEAYGTGGDINAFKNDNLITEAGVAGFSTQSGSGFSGQGNMEGDEPLDEGYDDEPYYDDVPKKKSNRWDSDDAEEDEDDEDLSEAEKAIDAVLKENSGKKLSILYAMENMDAIIDSMGLKKKVE
jgi:hypothetical protein